jgi:MSHA biogenesis protein MshJ
MSSYMDNLEAKFNTISVREQKLLFYVFPFVICIVFILGLLEPTIAQTINIRQQIKEQKLRLVEAANNVKLVQSELNLDTDLEIENQITAVNQQILILEKLFTDELEQLVPPYAMPLLLEQLFAKANKLRLMSMSSIPPSNIFGNDTKPTGSEDSIGPELFKHGLRIRFEGSYLDTRDFLILAEQMEWKLHWREIQFEVKEFPRAQVDIELFTLSRSEAYINVN